MDFFAFLWPIEWVVAWIIYGSHWLFTTLGMAAGPGTAWVLSIVALVIVIRIVLIPLFFKQIKASRGMQMIQPELQAVQKKYKGKTDPASRENMTRETMELYRKHGTNPFASCMPILLQSPIFFALFRVLNGLEGISTGDAEGIGPITQSVAGDIESSTLFGAQLSDVFLQTDSWVSRTVVIVLIVAMSVTTFTTQRQLTMKNMPPSALEGPMAQTQKMMLYMLPLVFAISGVNFPVGVLIYWTVTNVWSMGQQYYTIKRMPTPGSIAEKQMKERQAAKAAKRAAKTGEVIEDETPVVEQPKTGQRVQPKRKDRQKGAVRPEPTRPAIAQSAPQDAPDTTSGKQAAAKPKPSGTPSGKQPGSKPKPSGTAPGATPTSSGKRKQKK
ncbi:YidC/Oxa1 family membrane protein insertase [Promicromonospora umidemergens]|uniref:Membrane protein insertase YidC n=1 Tax=Promicromonospora umidemergens TaxID=629679 RepID=A0ABP8XPZ8_9MICO|nr:membrane protein insertase YidC [Promicromonospora umidemergens]MCP2285395.1 YidC/Oxa1 family membrane protein insertase [Promicromonospora umidemergens]